MSHNELISIVRNTRKLLEEKHMYTQNQATFLNQYIPILEDCKQNDPDYAYLKEIDSNIEELAQKMLKGLISGAASNHGKALQKTCKALGIKPTYKAIREFLTA